jgi:hypothetical protein
MLGCVVKDAPPDPWQEFLADVVWPFVGFNQQAIVWLVALVTVGSLIVGLVGDLTARERRVCGVLPVIMGAALFFLVFLTGKDFRWWAFRSEAQTTALAIGFCVGMLGLLVLERRVFIEDDD